MLIGDLARAAGVSTSAIRFWEREGLLPPPGRTSRGFREYDEEAVVRVRIVAGMRRLKASPDEVRAVMQVHEDRLWSQSRGAGRATMEPIDAATMRVRSQFDHACLEAARLGELLDALQRAKTHPEILAARCDSASARDESSADRAALRSA